MRSLRHIHRTIGMALCWVLLMAGCDSGPNLSIPDLAPKEMFAAMRSMNIDHWEKVMLDSADVATLAQLELPPELPKDLKGEIRANFDGIVKQVKAYGIDWKTVDLQWIDRWLTEQNGLQHLRSEIVFEDHQVKYLIQCRFVFVHEAWKAWPDVSLGLWTPQPGKTQKKR